MFGQLFQIKRGIYIVLYPSLKVVCDIACLLKTITIYLYVHTIQNCPVSATPFKIDMTFYMDLKKGISKKRPITKTVLNKKDKAGGITLLGFIQYKTTVITVACTRIRQTNRPL